MITINLIIQFAKKYWKIILIVLLFFALWCLAGYIIELRKENQRISSNFENFSKESDRKFNLTKDEYKNFRDISKTKIDSVMKENDLLHKKLRSAQVINTTYKDTSKTNVTHGQAQQISTTDQPKPSNDSIPVIQIKYFKIPVSVNEYCWGMKGVIYSGDPDSKLDITERTANNSIQRLEISNRFLGFLWPTKKSTFKVFTDCGESTITNINFVKN